MKYKPERLENMKVLSSLLWIGMSVKNRLIEHFDVFDTTGILILLILIGVIIGGLISYLLKVDDYINSIVTFIFIFVLFYRASSTNK